MMWAAAAAVALVATPVVSTQIEDPILALKLVGWAVVPGFLATFAGSLFDRFSAGNNGLKLAGAVVLLSLAYYTTGLLGGPPDPNTAGHMGIFIFPWLLSFSFAVTAVGFLVVRVLAGAGRDRSFRAP